MNNSKYIMDKTEYIVDRIENDYVILETKVNSLINIKKSDIIGTVKEGDILIKKDGLYFIDEEATKLRREKINTIMKGLWEE
ncbi:DUF3006 domain-containing protein [Clostridium sp. CTA-7]